MNGIVRENLYPTFRRCYDTGSTFRALSSALNKMARLDYTGRRRQLFTINMGSAGKLVYLPDPDYLVFYFADKVVADVIKKTLPTLGYPGKVVPNPEGIHNPKGHTLVTYFLGKRDLSVYVDEQEQRTNG